MADEELQTILNSGSINTIFIGGNTSGKKATIKEELDAVDLKTITNSTAITSLEAGNTPLSKLILTPQGTEPAHTEGTIFSKDGILHYQGAHVGDNLEVGRETQVEVLNNTGVTLLRGKAIRYNNVAGGKPAVVLGKADNFLNSRGLGVTAHDIPTGELGLVTTFGQIRDLDLSAFGDGDILFLSDTVAGEFTTTPPDIASSIGVVFNNDAINGLLFVNPTPNITFPATIARNKGQNNGNYSLIAGTPSNIIDYTTKQEVISTSDILTGVINCPAAGTYMFNFTFSGTLSDEEVDITVELFSITSASVLERHHFSSGRGSVPNLVPIADSWNVPTDIAAPNTDVVIRFTTAANETLILDEASFSMISTHIR